MRIDKQELVRVLHTEGENDLADRVAGAVVDAGDSACWTSARIRS